VRGVISDTLTARTALIRLIIAVSYSMQVYLSASARDVTHYSHSGGEGGAFYEGEAPKRAAFEPGRNFAA